MENVTKERVDDVLHAKWIIPVVPDNTVLENHSLIIKNGNSSISFSCICVITKIQSLDFKSPIVLLRAGSHHKKQNVMLLLLIVLVDI